MKTNHLPAALILCFIFISVHSFAQDEAKIEAKIHKMNKKMVEQMLKGEFTTDYYADDAISLPNQQPMLQGIEAIKASNEQAKAAGIKFESFDIKPVKIMINGNMVTEIGTYDMSMKIPNMPELYKETGKYLTLWEIQEDGELKIKVETWNTSSMPQM